MTHARLTIACLALLTLNGCALSPFRAFEQALQEAGIARFEQTPSASQPGRSVAVKAGRGGTGWGAVIGARRVLTVAHVVGDAEQVLVGTSRREKQGGWVQAQVVERIPAHPETLVVLELQVDGGAYGTLLGFAGFAVEDCFAFAPGGAPRQVLTGDRPAPWSEGVLRPGDSGSPVLDDAGVLVGIVSGRVGATPVHTPLPSVFTAASVAALVGTSTRG